MFKRFVLCGLLCLLLTMSSYWSKRRRIRAAVDAHISDLALAAQNGRGGGG